MEFTYGGVQCSLLGSHNKALYCQLYTSPKVMRKIGDALSLPEAERAFTRTLAHNGAEPWKKRTWAIYDAAGAQVGIQMLDRSAASPATAEIGIMLLPHANGKHIAFDALAGLVEVGLFRLQLKRIEATFDRSHLATRKLVTRVGFTLDDTLFEQAGRLCHRGAITARQRLLRKAQQKHALVTRNS